MIAAMQSLLSGWQPAELQLAVRLAQQQRPDIDPAAVATALRDQLGSDKSADDVGRLFSEVLQHADVVAKSAAAIQRPRRCPPRPIVEIKVGQPPPMPIEHQPPRQPAARRQSDESLQQSTAASKRLCQTDESQIVPLKPLATLTRPRTQILSLTPNSCTVSNSDSSITTAATKPDEPTPGSVSSTNGASAPTVKIIRLNNAANSNLLQQHQPMTPQVQTQYQTRRIQIDNGYVKITLRPTTTTQSEHSVSGSPAAQTKHSTAPQSLTLLPMPTATLSNGNGDISETFSNSASFIDSISFGLTGAPGRGGVDGGLLSLVEPTGGLQLPLLVEPNDADHPIVIN